MLGAALNSNDSKYCGGVTMERRNEEAADCSQITILPFGAIELVRRSNYVGANRQSSYTNPPSGSPQH